MEKTVNTVTLVQGGNSEKLNMEEAIFESAFAINARLMGVLGLIIKRIKEIDGQRCEIYQLFYFDIEEYGFDTYKRIFISESFKNEGLKLLEDEEQKLYGGLGSTKVKLTEKQANYLICKYIRFNKKHKIPLPGLPSDYMWIAENEPVLTYGEKDQLMSTICKNITSENELLNYFIMRCVGRDFEGAEYLTDKKTDVRILPFKKPSVLLMNSVEKSPSGDTLCVSIVESEETHYHVVTKVSTLMNRVTSFSLESVFRISPEETALILAEDSFVLSYKLFTYPENMIDEIGSLFKGSLINKHNNGTLITYFKSNNNHVDEPVFRLDHDVSAMILITYMGEIVISAKSPLLCGTAANMIFSPVLNRNKKYTSDSKQTGAYRFQFNIIPMFFDSDMYSFDDFISLLTRPGIE